MISMWKSSANLFKEVGAVGFILITLFVFFICQSDSKQKNEFIDRFFLLKLNEKCQNDFLYFIPMTLGITLILVVLYYTAKVDLAYKGMDRISNEKNRLQEELTGKKLKSSKK